MVKIPQTKKVANENAAKSTKKTSKKAKASVPLSDDEEINNSDNNQGKSISSPLLNECKMIFGSECLYTVLGIDKASATQNDIKKAYYKLSLKYHPDKCTDPSKIDDSKIKFQLIGKVYSVLKDEERKKIYDETGSIDGEDDFLMPSGEKDWDNYFRNMFKKITKKDIEKFYENYRNTEEEKQDILNAYEKHKGDMNLIIQEVLSEDLIEDEPRVKKIINDAIENKLVQKYDIFANENKKRANKRKAFLEKEAKEAEELKNELGVGESQEDLKNAILSRRKNESDNFIKHLENKFGGKKNGKNKTSKKPSKESDDECEECDIEDDLDENDEEEETESQPPKKSAKKTKPENTKKEVPVVSRRASGRTSSKVKRL